MEKAKNIHFSSKSVEWATPQDFFDKLNAEFGFELDVCATPDNAKCAEFFTVADDGLSQPWNGVCWMNPPYKRGKLGIAAWIKKAYESSLNGATVVCLVPSRTDTRWWWDFVMPFYPEGIRYVKGRIHFVGAGEDGAPFPSAVVVMRNLYAKG